MKYIQSFTAFESNFSGVFIPKAYYSLAEQNRGAKNIVGVNDDQIEALQKDKVFQAMLKKGDLKILDTLPDQYVDANEKVKRLNEENTKLKDELKKVKVAK